MSDHPHANDASAICAFCSKSLPVAGDLIQPWRSATGLLFCNEFCADDAEEARFQNRRRPYQASGDTLRLVRSDAR